MVGKRYTIRYSDHNILWLDKKHAFGRRRVFFYTCRAEMHML